MRTFKKWMVVPAALVMLLSNIGTAYAQTRQITPGFELIRWNFRAFLKVLKPVMVVA